MTPLVVALLSTSDEIRQHVRNTDKQTNVGYCIVQKDINGIDKCTCLDGTGHDNKWSSAEWRTALYDLKTRKFKCTKMDYSLITGRINSICFEEIRFNATPSIP